MAESSSLTMGIWIYLRKHLVHHKLTLWALGAKPATIRLPRERNGQYQRSSLIIQDNLVEDLAIRNVFKRCMGRDENYRNYERFFLTQINEHGYEAALQKDLLGGGEVADDMLCRRKFLRRPLTFQKGRFSRCMLYLRFLLQIDRLVVVKLV